MGPIMPNFDRVIRYLPVNRTPAWPVTVGGSSAGVTVRTVQNAERGNASSWMLEKNGAPVGNAALAGTVPAGSVVKIDQGIYELAQPVDFAGGDVAFEHTWAIRYVGSNLDGDPTGVTVWHLAETVDRTLNDEWLAEVAARVPGQTVSPGTAFDFRLAAGIVNSSPRVLTGSGALLGPVPFGEDFIPLAFGAGYALSSPAPGGGFQIGARNAVLGPLFGNLISTGFFRDQPAEFSATLKPARGTALARIKSVFIEGTRQAVDVEPILFAGETGAGLRAWARLEDETLSESVDDAGELRQIAESNWTVNRTRLADTANLIIDDANNVWSIVGLERLDRITDRIVCRRDIV